MEFEGLLKNIVDEAKKKKKTIVLPESNDIRVVKAANIASQENIANIILILSSLTKLRKYSGTKFSVQFKFQI